MPSTSDWARNSRCAPQRRKLSALRASRHPTSRFSDGSGTEPCAALSRADVGSAQRSSARTAQMAKAQARREKATPPPKPIRRHFQRLFSSSIWSTRPALLGRLGPEDVCGNGRTCLTPPGLWVIAGLQERRGCGRPAVACPNRVRPGRGGMDLSRENGAH